MGCYTDDFLFVHIPKTGGTAVKAALWEQVPGMKGQRPAFPGSGEAERGKDPNDPFPIGHMRLRDVETILGRPWGSFKQVVAVIRNPYVQQVSQWLFWLDRYHRGGRHLHDLAAAGYATIHGFLEDPRCDFHRWYSEEFRLGDTRFVPTNDYKDFGGTYLWWLEGSDGKIPSNLVLLRQEQLAGDFARWSRESFGRPLEVPPMNVGGWDHDKLLEYLVHPDRPHETMRALDLIEAKFRWAFGLHYVHIDRSQFIGAWLDAGLITPTGV